MSEKIKNYLGMALIIASLAFAFAAVGFVVTRPDYSERTFSVDAEGEIVSIPDIGKFTFSVLTEGSGDAADAQIKNTEASNKVIEYLKAQGVVKEDIKSTGYYINPRYRYYDCRPVYSALSSETAEACPPPDIVGYTIEHILSVKVRDLENAGTLVGGAVENGANTVSELAFEVDDPAQAKQDAIEEATAKARAKAEAIAEAGGFRIGKLVSISTSDTSYPIPYYADYGYGGKGGEEALASASPAVEPGSQSITVTVYLTYEIK
ncbi:MAG: SIMPL domain-containing protein [Candidatus Colwellbacteria bacterium]|nr:SIMPL domain-containing protein [Candidatus Colwellbacteria bacterium]